MLSELQLNGPAYYGPVMTRKELADKWQVHPETVKKMLWAIGINKGKRRLTTADVLQFDAAYGVPGHYILKRMEDDDVPAMKVAA